MRVIRLPRAAGKTTEVLQWFMEDPMRRAVVTDTAHEAMRLRSILAREFSVSPYGGELRRIVPVMDSRSLRGLYVRELAVDNIERVMGHVLNGPIDLMTYTEPLPSE